MYSVILKECKTSLHENLKQTMPLMWNSFLGGIVAE